MQKRLLSLALSLAMLLTMTPLVVGAAGDEATVKIVDTTLESGKYYVPATGQYAQYRVIDTATQQPEDNYLTFDNGTLTVHGNVSLTSGGPILMAVSGGALTITGTTGSSLSLSRPGNSLQIAEDASVTLSGAVDFSAEATSNSAAIQLSGDLTTKEYSGDIDIRNSYTSGSISGVITDGVGSSSVSSELSLVTTGTISIARETAPNLGPAMIWAKNIVIQGNSVTLADSLYGTIAAATGDISIAVTAGDLSIVSQNQDLSVLQAQGTITLSAPEKIGVSAGTNDSPSVSYAIRCQKLILNNAKRAELTCSGTAPLVSPAEGQIEANVGTLVITQNGKTIVTKGDQTYDGDITTAGLNYTAGLPTEQATYLAGEGTAVFTPAEGETPATLTLKNATAGNIRLGADGVNIVVEGENTIGQLTATSTDVNVTGTGSLTVTSLQAANNGVIVDIDGDLVINGGAVTMIMGETAITAASVTLNGDSAISATGKNVRITAKTGDIKMAGGTNGYSYLAGSGILSAILTAEEGNIISEYGALWSPTILHAKKDIIFMDQYSSKIVQVDLTATSDTGNISFINTCAYGTAIQAPNSKVTLNANNKVTISSKYEQAPVIQAKQLTIKGKKVTITGIGKGRFWYPVIEAAGTIHSDDLFIKASATNGYAVVAPTGGQIKLTGKGQVIGQGVNEEHDSDIIFLGASAGELNGTNLSNTIQSATSTTVLNSGDGYAIYDPTAKTLLLQDAVITDAVSLPSNSGIAVTINGSLTIESGSLQLENAESVTVESNAPISLAEDTSLTLPATATAKDLNSLNLSGTGSVGYGDQSGTVTALVYELDGGVNADTNPTTYIGFAADEAPTGYYPIALTAPTKEGYTFQGWYTDESYTTKVEEIKDNTVTTLYAKWEKQAQNNGGSSGSSSSSSSNAVTAPGKTENGSISVGAKNAKKGDTVTITVTPSSGYQVGQVTVKDASGNTVAVKDLGGGKYSFVMPATKVSVDASFVKEVTPAADFVDVAANAWYKDAVDYVVQKGLMTGTGEKEFSPQAPMTRAMLMTVLARYAGEDTSGGATWYEKGMAWAVANGVSDGSDPTGNITREQLVTMLYRYAGSPKTSGSLAAFADADTVSEYAVQAMQWAVEQGILTGITPTTITPQGNATRAQVATILMRFCQGQGA